MLENLSKYEIVLASNSPRRRDLLLQLGLGFKIRVLEDIDESCPSGLSGEEAAKHIALKKAEAYRKRMDDNDLLITADTIVCIDNTILGKPRDVSDARRMLSLLSGRTHSVITGIGVTANGVTYVSHSNTKVVVDKIPNEEIERYIASGDPMDKAGAYGIQSGFSRWVRGIDGCYFGVVGLPVNALNKLYFEVTGKWL